VRGIVEDNCIELQGKNITGIAEKVTGLSKLLKEHYFPIIPA
jgi:hypothetical protein